MVSFQHNNRADWSLVSGWVFQHFFHERLQPMNRDGLWALLNVVLNLLTCPKAIPVLQLRDKVNEKNSRNEQSSSFVWMPLRSHHKVSHKIKRERFGEQSFHRSEKLQNNGKVLLNSQKALKSWSIDKTSDSTFTLIMSKSVNALVINYICRCFMDYRRLKNPRTF